MDCEICKDCGKNTKNCRCGSEDICITCPLLLHNGLNPKCVTVRLSKCQGGGIEKEKIE